MSCLHYKSYEKKKGRTYDFIVMYEESLKWYVSDRKIFVEF